MRFGGWDLEDLRWRGRAWCLKGGLEKSQKRGVGKEGVEKNIEGDLLFCSFFYLGFLSQTFIIHRTSRKGEGYLFNSSLPLPLASQTFEHQLGDYCRGLTRSPSQESNENREPLVFGCKPLNTEPRALMSLLLRNFFNKTFSCRMPRDDDCCQDKYITNAVKVTCTGKLFLAMLQLFMEYV